MVPEAGRRARLETLAGLGVLVAIALLFTAALSAQESGEEETIDFSSLENPVPFTEASIERGRVLYRRRCTECHGLDGKGMIDVIADATDLTDPDLWYSGTEEWEVFRSIREGAGENMPPYKFHFPDDRDMWDLVNFVRSLWPEGRRPPLVEDASD